MNELFKGHHEATVWEFSQACMEETDRHLPEEEWDFWKNSDIFFDFDSMYYMGGHL